MIPDGLSPDEHWQVACKLVHPMLIRPEVHEPVRVALANAPEDPEEHVEWALKVQELVRKLEGAVRDDGLGPPMGNKGCSDPRRPYRYTPDLPHEGADICTAPP